MTEPLDKLDYYQQFQMPMDIPVSFPAGYGHLRESIHGTLHKSSNGYIYNDQPSEVLWLKFLGLAVFLPIRGCIGKCVELAKRCFGADVSSKGLHDLSHVGHLSKIAWKAVILSGNHSLMARVNEFALAELDYNNPDRETEMDRSRSDRILNGVYAAKCMQPLFHESQYTPSGPLKERIRELNQQYQQLNEARIFHSSPPENRGFLQSLSNYFFSSQNPYLKWPPEKAFNELMTVNKELRKLEKVLDRSERCQRYAYQAIFSQQCCPDLAKNIEDTFVETQEEVTCGGETCYRKQRICGVVHKIDCCGTRCWAVDLLCCMVCLWPEGRTWCMIG